MFSALFQAVRCKQLALNKEQISGYGVYVSPKTADPPHDYSLLLTLYSLQFSYARPRLFQL